LTLLCLLHVEAVELVETLHYVRHAADLLRSNFPTLEAAGFGDEVTCILDRSRDVVVEASDEEDGDDGSDAFNDMPGSPTANSFMDIEASGCGTLPANSTVIIPMPGCGMPWFAHARCSWCLVTLMRTAPTGTSHTSMYVPSASVVTHRLRELHLCEHMQAACSLHVLLQSSCRSVKKRWHLEDPSFGVAL